MQESLNSAILNRIKKKYKTLKRIQKENSTNAYRLYNQDIPDYPFVVDVYNNNIVIDDYFDEKKDLEKSHHRDEIIEAINIVFKNDLRGITLKDRFRQKQNKQYTKNREKAQFTEVLEFGNRIKVNLSSYIDTGIFLDHRPIRKILHKNSNGKKLLNLFSYTCVVGLQSAIGGAKTTNVDLSKTYLEWGKDNYKLNSINLEKHEFINIDVLKYLEKVKEKFDIIFLDPPSFSNSKKMDWTLDVQKDHLKLIELCMKALNENGVLYFSNNLKKFQLDENVSNLFNVRDLTLKSIPEDFRGKKPHRLFEILKARKE